MLCCGRDLQAIFDALLDARVADVSAAAGDIADANICYLIDF